MDQYNSEDAHHMTEKDFRSSLHLLLLKQQSLYLLE